MTTVTVEEVQNDLSSLIEHLADGESLLIVRGSQPVAHLTRLSPARPKPVFGNCKGMLEILSDDDEHLADFREYME